VAGDADILGKFLLYRTYHGCAMPVATQLASIAAWNDEAHVLANRDAYRDKFATVLAILDGCLDVTMPDASFYLWPRVDGSDTDFARRLFAEQNITALPGSFLGRDSAGGNPGAGHIRMALVATLAECTEAARRIRTFMQKG
jgi:N-succinyldiaminopimelate aminotransferase